MKKLGILIVVLLCCQAVWAQEGRPKHRMHLDKRMEMMDSALDLSQEQSQEIRAIIAAEMPKMRELHRSGASRDSIQAVRDQIHHKVAAQLTDEQRVKFDQMKDERQGMHHKGKGLKGRGDNGPHQARPDSMRKDHREAMRAKRMSFDAQLNDDERETIAKVREKLQSMKPEKGAMDSLSKADRLRHQADRLDVLAWLDPIVAEHKDELDSLFKDMPQRQGKMGQGPHHLGKGKADSQRRYYRFLMIKPSE